MRRHETTKLHERDSIAYATEWEEVPYQGWASEMHVVVCGERRAHLEVVATRSMGVMVRLHEDNVEACRKQEEHGWGFVFPLGWGAGPLLGTMLAEGLRIAQGESVETINAEGAL